MATLTYQQVLVGGLTPTLAAATSGGDSFAPNDRGMLVVKNSSGSPITVTIVVPGNTKYGLANPDLPAFSVAAGATSYFGPFPSDLGDTATDGLVDVTYSAVTTVTVGMVQL